MTKLIFLRGLPASGKSTWAREQIKAGNGQVKRINKDELRLMIDNDNHSKGRENNILKMQWMMVENMLKSGYDVILDNTHFNPVHLKRARELIDQLNLVGKPKYELIEKFFDTPLEECLIRDRERGNKSVGRDVIMQMYNQYLKPAPMGEISTLPSCIIVDLDGTLARFEGNPYSRDFENDVLSKQVAFVISSYRGFDGVWDTGDKSAKVIIFSGRSAQFEEVTRAWLEKHQVSYDLLVMRAVGDSRPDYIVKDEMYGQHIAGKFNVSFVIDDRPQVVRLWKSKGLFVFDVNQSGMEF